MKLDLFDTYVSHRDGLKMHFDVLLPHGSTLEQAKDFTNQWLKEIGVDTSFILLDSCRFCHSQTAFPEHVHALSSHGFAIIQMEGCPAPVF